MCLRFFTWCLVCFMIVPALAWAQHPNSKAEQASGMKWNDRVVVKLDN